MERIKGRIIKEEHEDNLENLNTFTDKLAQSIALAMYRDRELIERMERREQSGREYRAGSYA